MDEENSSKLEKFEVPLSNLSSEIDKLTIGLSDECDKDATKQYEFRNPNSWLKITKTLSARHSELWSEHYDRARCLKTHVRVAAEYHKFQYDVQSCKKLSNYLNNYVEALPKTCMDLKELVELLQHVTMWLLNLQDLMDSISQRSPSISPVNQRVNLQRPHSATVLVDYFSQEVALRVNDVVTVTSLTVDVDMSEELSQYYWTITVNANKMGSRTVVVPAIILVLDAGHEDISAVTLELHETVISVWKHCILISRVMFMKTISEEINQGNMEKTRDPKDCGSRVDLLRSADAMFPEKDQQCETFNKIIQDLRSKITRDCTYSSESRYSNAWDNMKKSFTFLSELKNYAAFYSTDFGSARQKSEVNVTGMGDSRFVSNAYINTIPSKNPIRMSNEEFLSESISQMVVDNESNNFDSFVIVCESKKSPQLTVGNSKSIDIKYSSKSLAVCHTEDMEVMNSPEQNSVKKATIDDESHMTKLTKDQASQQNDAEVMEEEFSTSSMQNRTYSIPGAGGKDPGEMVVAPDTPDMTADDLSDIVLTNPIQEIKMAIHTRPDSGPRRNSKGLEEASRGTVFVVAQSTSVRKSKEDEQSDPPQEKTREDQPDFEYEAETDDNNWGNCQLVSVESDGEENNTVCSQLSDQELVAISLKDANGMSPISMFESDPLIAEEDGVIVGVIDLQYHTLLSAEEAQHRGILSDNADKYLDHYSDTWMPIKASATSGYVCVIPVTQVDKVAVNLVYAVRVYDPVVHRFTNHTDAKDRGIVDLKDNLYHFVPNTSSSFDLTLCEAGLCGFIVLSTYPSTFEECTPNEVFLLKIHEDCKLSLDDVIENSNRSAMNIDSLKCIKEADCFDHFFTEENSKEALSFPQALARDVIISVDPLLWNDPKSASCESSIFTAVLTGYLSRDKALALLKSYRRFTVKNRYPKLHDLIVSKMGSAILISGCDLRDLLQTTELKENAPSDCFLMSFTNCSILSLKCIIENFSESNWYFIDFNPEQFGVMFEELSNLPLECADLVKPCIKTFTDPTQPLITLCEAVFNGTLNLSMAQYHPNLVTSAQPLSITEASQLEYGDAQILSDLSRALNEDGAASPDQYALYPLRLEEVFSTFKVPQLESAVIRFDNEYLPPISLLEAVKVGWLNSDSLVVADPHDKVSLLYQGDMRSIEILHTCTTVLDSLKEKKMRLKEDSMIELTSESLQDRISNYKELLNSIQELEANISDLQISLENLQTSGNLSSNSDLTSKVQDLKTQSQEIRTQIETRLSSINNVKLLSIKFHDQYKTSAKVLKDVYSDLMESRSQNEKESQDNHETEAKISNIEEKLRILSQLKIHLTSYIQDYERQLNSYRFENGHLPPITPDSLPIQSSLHDKVVELEAEMHALKSVFPTKSESRTNQRNKRHSLGFTEPIRSIESRLSELEQHFVDLIFMKTVSTANLQPSVQALTEESFYNETSNDLESKLQSVNDISGQLINVTAQMTSVKESLKTASLLSKFNSDSADCSAPFLEEEQQLFSRLRERRGRLDESLEHSRQCINKALQQHNQMSRRMRSQEENIQQLVHNVSAVIEKGINLATVPNSDSVMQECLRLKREVLSLEQTEDRLQSDFSKLSKQPHHHPELLFKETAAESTQSKSILSNLRIDIDSHLEQFGHARKLIQEINEAAENQSKWITRNANRFNAPASTSQDTKIVKSLKSADAELSAAEKALLTALKQDKPSEERKLQSLQKRLVDLNKARNSESVLNRIIESKEKWTDFWNKTCHTALTKIKTRLEVIEGDRESFEQSLSQMRNKRHFSSEDNMELMKGLDELSVNVKRCLHGLAIIDPLYIELSATQISSSPFYVNFPIDVEPASLSTRLLTLSESILDTRNHFSSSFLPLLADYNDRKSLLTQQLTDAEQEMECFAEMEDDPPPNLDIIKEELQQSKDLEVVLAENGRNLSDLAECARALCEDSDQDYSLMLGGVESLKEWHKRLESRVKKRLSSLQKNLLDFSQWSDNNISEAIDDCFEELMSMQSEFSDSVKQSTSIRPDHIQSKIQKSSALLSNLSAQESSIHNLRNSFGWRSSTDAKPKSETSSSPPEEYETFFNSEDWLAVSNQVKDSPSEGEVGDGGGTASLSRLCDTEKLCQELRHNIETELNHLRDTKCASEEFWSAVRGGQTSVNKLHSEMNGVKCEYNINNVAELKASENMLNDINQRIETMVDQLPSITDKGKELVKQCEDQFLRDEIQLAEKGLSNAIDDLKEDFEEKRFDFDETNELAHRVDEKLKSFKDYLPQFEELLKSIGEPQSTCDALKSQLKELKSTKIALYPHLTDAEALTEDSEQLIHLGRVYNPTVLSDAVEEIKQRWNQLAVQLVHKETALQQRLFQASDIDSGLKELADVLHEINRKLQNLSTDNKPLDLLSLEELMTDNKNVKLLNSDLFNLATPMHQLNMKVIEIPDDDNDPTVGGIFSRSRSLQEEYASLKLQVNVKADQLQEKLKDRKVLFKQIEEKKNFLRDFKSSLSRAPPLGAKPQTAKAMIDRYQKHFESLQNCQSPVAAILSRGEQLLNHPYYKNNSKRAATLRRQLDTLKCSWDSTWRRSNLYKKQLEQHHEKVKMMSTQMADLTKWIKDMDVKLNKFKSPSKITQTCADQIKEVKKYVESAECQKNTLNNLCSSGTYLKHCGSKTEALYVNNLISNMQLKFTKLLRRADERSRILEQTYKEDKRFSDSWTYLTETINKIVKQSSDLKSSQTPAPDKMNHIKLLIGQLNSLSPRYYTTLRWGKNLIGLCTRNDPERAILLDMVQQLRNQWSSAQTQGHTVKSDIETKLLHQGRASEVVDCIIEWIKKVESFANGDLSSDGRVDKAEFLLDYHRTVIQEMRNYETFVKNLGERVKSGNDLQKLHFILEKWPKVCAFIKERYGLLQNELQRAEELQNLNLHLCEWMQDIQRQMNQKKPPSKSSQQESEETFLVQQRELMDKIGKAINSKQDELCNFVNKAESLMSGSKSTEYLNKMVDTVKSRYHQLENNYSAHVKWLNESIQKLHGETSQIEDCLQNLFLIDKEMCFMEEICEEKSKLMEHNAINNMLEKQKTWHNQLVEMGKFCQTLINTKSRDKILRMKKNSTSNLLVDGSGDTSPIYGTRSATLIQKHRHLLRRSIDLKEKLELLDQDLKEKESFKNFNFEEWRLRFLNWVKKNKLSLTYLFRQQDHNSSGTLGRDEFVKGILKTNFKTNRTELNAVFDIFNQRADGEMAYAEFMNALKPERKLQNLKPPVPKENLRSSSVRRKDQSGNELRSRHRSSSPSKRSASLPQKCDRELIHEAIEKETAKCNCLKPVFMVKVAEGKYKMSDGRLYLVRYLNSSVLVRVGGGWQNIAEFLNTHDPCRAKGRTNTQLREQFILPDGSSQARKAFVNSRNKNGSRESLNSGSTISVNSRLPSPSLRDSHEMNISASCSDLLSSDKATSKPSTPSLSRKSKR